MLDRIRCCWHQTSNRTRLLRALLSHLATMGAFLDTLALCSDALTSPVSCRTSTSTTRTVSHCRASIMLNTAFSQSFCTHPPRAGTLACRQAGSPHLSAPVCSRNPKLFQTHSSCHEQRRHRHKHGVPTSAKHLRGLIAQSPASGGPCTAHPTRLLLPHAHFRSPHETYRLRLHRC